MEPFQPPSGFALLLQLLNILTGVVVIYGLFSVPAQIIRRIRRLRRGEVVSPMLLVLRKLLKNWFFSALVIIPASVVLIIIAGNNAGLSAEDIYVAAVTQGILGNILTSLVFGYAFMKLNKGGWSLSKQDAKTSNS